MRKLLLLITMITFIASGSAIAQTVGPNGEQATPSKQVTVAKSDVKKVKNMKLKAALLWHDQSDFVNAVTAGAKDEFKRLGVKVVAEANAAFDAAKQKADIENALIKSPNIILSLPLDPATSAAAFREAKDEGVSLVFLSNLPAGYQHPQDYAAIVTDDLFAMGKQAADALAKSMGKKGTVGWIYHDAAYYVTNQRDNAFKKTIETDYPNIKIVAESGLADPARAEEIANAMLLKNPNIGGIYTPWAGPAEGVLAALRANGNKKTKLVTLDLSEPVALDMVNGGNVVAITADEAYELGRAMAAAGVNKILGKKVPAFVIAPAITATPKNVEKVWKQSLNIQAPKSVRK
ncbi:MAG: substrate-binding domain-containing protein [Alphaproteobacteria bacterium]|nr:substrate-binding domain-containing protein [Alphaproteobacteria bacterium]